MISWKLKPRNPFSSSVACFLKIVPFIFDFLTFFSIGLGLLEGIWNINEGRNRTYHLVERLKSRFLLFSDQPNFVKMHDVVRDVAIFIGSKEKHGFLKCLQVSLVDSPSLDSSCDSRWMSINTSNGNVELPVIPNFQNLCLLLVRKPGGLINSERIDDNIDVIVGMVELKVLSFFGINFGSFSPTQKWPRKLKVLQLVDVPNLRDIFYVGELTSLEILLICSCSSIEELPANFRRLNRLRLLEVRYCYKLERIAKGVISSLVGLEELKIVESFDQWGVKVNGSEERNASLLELESLCNLSWLEIEISDSNLVAQQICLSQQLVRYGIHFTKSRDEFYFPLQYDERDYERNISLDIPRDIPRGNWIDQLVRSTQSLRLNGDGANCFNLADIESLKKLIFSRCSMVKSIDCKFNMLEHLHLEDLREVESIVDGIIPEGSNFFQKLQVLRVKELPKLAHLWRSPTQNVTMPNLQEIIIHDCPNLRALFSLVTTKSLVRLQLLEIVRCRAIEQVFWNEIEEFPQLAELKIIDCPNLATKIGKFPKLQSIHLDAFSGLRHLLSSYSHRTWITQLRRLSIHNCDDVEEIFWDDIEDEGNRHIIFPKLEELELGDLPCLTTFYRGVETINFPKLETIRVIGNLARMNYSVVPMDSEASHDDHCLHFFCNEKVEIPRLRQLFIVETQDDIRKVWCPLVPINFFRKLRELHIYFVDGIRNLMSSSIALNLVNLDQLHIYGCEEMIEVIEDDLEISITSLFPRVTHIALSRLHKLKSFCQWKHTLEFPSLEYVHIEECAGMETFTLGSLSTPNYLELRMDSGPLEKKDLNGSIREHFINESRKAQREKTEEEEGREKTEDMN